MVTNLSCFVNEGNVLLFVFMNTPLTDGGGCFAAAAGEAAAAAGEAAAAARATISGMFKGLPFHKKEIERNVLHVSDKRSKPPCFTNRLLHFLKKEDLL